MWRKSRDITWKRHFHGVCLTIKLCPAAPACAGHLDMVIMGKWLRSSVWCLQEGFYGMLPVTRLAVGPLQKFGIHWSRNLRFAAAVCNGLVMKGKTGCIGDALEKSLFQAVEAQFVVRQLWNVPGLASMVHTTAMLDHAMQATNLICCSTRISSNAWSTCSEG